MAFRRSAHAVYDCQYHLVWCPKYRKAILQGVIASRMRGLLSQIAAAYDIEIEEMEVAIDHVHVFCAFPPRLSIAQVVTRFKSLSARAVFAEFPQVRKQLWGGEFWSDGYFARTVGDGVTADVIRRYIARHRSRPSSGGSLSHPALFPDPDEES